MISFCDLLKCCFQVPLWDLIFLLWYSLLIYWSVAILEVFFCGFGLYSLLCVLFHFYTNNYNTSQLIVICEYNWCVSSLSRPLMKILNKSYREANLSRIPLDHGHIRVYYSSIYFLCLQECFWSRHFNSFLEFHNSGTLHEVSGYIMPTELYDFLKMRTVDLLMYPRFLEALFACKTVKTKCFCELNEWNIITMR